MPVSDTVQTLRAALDAVDQHMPLLDDAANHISVADASVKAAEEHKAQIELQIRSSQANLERMLAEGEQKLMQQKTDFAQKAKEYSDQIVALQTKISVLDTTVREKQSRHDQLEASLDSIRKKLVG